MLLISALVLAFGMVISTVVYGAKLASYNIKPKKALMTCNIVKITEQSEQLQFGVTLFEDETGRQHQAKIDYAFEIAEKRLEFQNSRLIEIQKKAQSEFEAAKAAKAAEGKEKAAT